MTEVATSPDTMLRLILTSRVYDVAHETPLEPASGCRAGWATRCCSSARTCSRSSATSCAAPTTASRTSPRRERARGVIAASAGNHAQGVAFAARHLGLRALIVMPQTTPEIKVEAVRELGAEVVLAGDSYAEAQARCDELVATTGLTFVHPFDDPHGHRRSGHGRRTRSCGTSWATWRRSSCRSAAAG